MTVLTYEVNDLEGNFALSCIENYLICVLKKFNQPYQALYIYSYLDIDETVLDFIEKDFDYAFYEGIDRLQYTAEEINLIEVKFQNITDNNLIKYLENELNKGFPILIEVDSYKLPNENKIYPWRDDHYIMLFSIRDNIIQFIDDVPRRSISLSKDSIFKAFKGNICTFELLGKFDKYKYYEELCRQILKLTNDIEQDLYQNLDRLMSFEDLIQFRDAIGILRISRNRIKHWFKWIISYYNLSEYKGTLDYLDVTINILNRLYSTLEIYRLRNKNNRAVIRDLFKDLKQSEYEWLTNIK